MPWRGDVYILPYESIKPPVFSEVCPIASIFATSSIERAMRFQIGMGMPIWMGEHTHRTPYEGNHGIQFEDVRTERPARTG